MCPDQESVHLRLQTCNLFACQSAISSVPNLVSFPQAIKRKHKGETPINYLKCKEGSRIPGRHILLKKQDSIYIKYRVLHPELNCFTEGRDVASWTQMLRPTKILKMILISLNNVFKELAAFVWMQTIFFIHAVYCPDPERLGHTVTCHLWPPPPTIPHTHNGKKKYVSHIGLILQIITGA